MFVVQIGKCYTKSDAGEMVERRKAGMRNYKAMTRYFPMQKVEKIRVSMSSVVVSPVISPRYRIAL